MLAKDLTGFTAGRPLTNVAFLGRRSTLTKMIPSPVQRAFLTMRGHPVRITSNGKHLYLSVRQTRVQIRLGMTGWFQVRPVPREYAPHHFATLVWGNRRAHFLDFRRFSRMAINAEEHKGALGGFEPIKGFFLAPARELSVALNHSLRGFHSRPRITWLLNHGVRTGIGNYLANEALGRLGLSPFEACRDRKEALALLTASQKLAKESFACGGTSFGIGYFRLDGSEGTFAQKLRVYRHPAARRAVLNGRPVYFRPV